jgi:hypothetical protein
VGVVFDPLGAVGSTYWADWIDLLVPYAVVGFAASVLVAADPSRTTWAAFGLAAIAYTQGHGIHLAANSIARVYGDEPAHLWDEVVGHWIWYGGLTLLVATLAYALDREPLRAGVLAYALAIAFGLTVFTNSVEGGTPALGLAASVVFVGWGLRRRGRAPWLLLPTYAVALAALVAWGVYWGGFPQFSELDWI